MTGMGNQSWIAQIPFCIVQNFSGECEIVKDLIRLLES